MSDGFALPPWLDTDDCAPTLLFKQPLTNFEITALVGFQAHRYSQTGNPTSAPAPGVDQPVEWALAEVQSGVIPSDVILGRCLNGTVFKRPASQYPFIPSDAVPHRVWGSYR
jgi:hypothetical protein